MNDEASWSWILAYWNVFQRFVQSFTWVIFQIRHAWNHIRTSRGVDYRIKMTWSNLLQIFNKVQFSFEVQFLTNLLLDCIVLYLLLLECWFLKVTFSLKFFAIFVRTVKYTTINVVKNILILTPSPTFTQTAADPSFPSMSTYILLASNFSCNSSHMRSLMK